MQTKSRSTNESTGQAKKLLNFPTTLNNKITASLYFVSHITEHMFGTKQSAHIDADTTYIPDV